MEQIQTSLFNAIPSQTNNQRSVEPVIPLSILKIQSESNPNSQVYIKTGGTEQAMMSVEFAARDINDATALVQSVEETAALIENKFVDMKALALQGGGCACQAMRKMQESIKEISNDFSWNGKNFMVGGGEENQNTTLRNLTVAAGGETKDEVKLSFKSFNPMSAVDTKGSLEPETPNLPDLNKSSGTDTHAYGDAALYSQLNKEAYLHIHTSGMKKHAVIQISRAIDGIQSERERLLRYITKLNNIAETNQKNALTKNKYMSQIVDPKQADQTAMYIKSEISNSSADVNLAQFNIRPAEFNRLLS